MASPPVGFAPTTLALTKPRSELLSYGGKNSSVRQVTLTPATYFFCVRQSCQRNISAGIAPAPPRLAPRCALVHHTRMKKAKETKDAGDVIPSSFAAENGPGETCTHNPPLKRRMLLLIELRNQNRTMGLPRLALGVFRLRAGGCTRIAQDP